MSYLGGLDRAGITSDGTNVQIPGLSRTVGRGKALYVDGTNGANAHTGRTPKQALLTLTKALSLLTANSGDIVYVLGATTSVAQAAVMDWNVNLCHVAGEGQPGFWNQRSRIEQTAAFAGPMLTVSGYGNSFRNLYFMTGYTSDTGYTSISITGGRNTFQRCHFLPQIAASMDQSTYRLVSVNNSEQSFIECFIGGDGATMSAGALLQLGATGDGGPPRAIFKDCVFFMKSDAAGAFFIDTGLGGLGTGWGIFLNCHFLNLGTSLTYAINGAGLNNYQLYFDNKCSFVGATDIVALGQENYVWFGGVNMPINQVNTASVALFNGLACHPDVS
jgi:hypothetical protein